MGKFFKPNSCQHSSNTLSRPHQTNFDSVITCDSKQPLFTINNLLDYIVELFVDEDEVAFQLVERGGFCSLLCYCWPSLSDKDIPKHKTVRAEIL